MMRENRKVDRSHRLAIGLVLASLIYICCELIFNTLLLDTASRSDSDISRFEHIEILGRALSGIGISLLIISVLKDKLSGSTIRLVIGIPVVIVIAWPTTFFTQKILVDKLIIDSADAAELKQATTTMIFKQALVSGTVVIDSLQYDPHNNSVSDKAFSALFSSLILLGDSEADFIEDNMDRVIRSYVSSRFSEEQKQWLRLHQTLFEEISNTYENDYLLSSRVYSERYQNLSIDVAQLRAEVERMVYGMWDAYQRNLEHRENEALLKAKEYAPELIRYFSNYNSRCFRGGRLNQRCANQIDRNYYQLLDNAGIERVEPGYWLQSSDGAFLQRIGNLFRGIATQGYNYSTDIDHYYSRILALPENIARFEHETGYPLSIDDLSDFRTNPITSRHIAKKLRERGIDLISNWHIDNDEALLVEALRNHVAKTIEDEWQQNIQRQGLKLPPNLTWAEFEAHSSVQKQIAENLGELYVPEYKLSWSDAEFQRQVINPRIQKQGAGLIAQWKAPIQQFEPAGIYYDIGRSNLRAAVVPPIAMALSLLLIAFNILKLPKEILASIKKGRLQKHSFRSSARSLCYLAALFILIFLLPLKLVDNSLGKDQNRITAHLMADIDKNTGPLASFALNWVMHAQPILYPMAEPLVVEIDVLGLSKPAVERMLEWDRVVLNR